MYQGKSIGNNNIKSNPNPSIKSYLPSQYHNSSVLNQSKLNTKIKEQREEIVNGGMVNTNSNDHYDREYKEYKELNKSNSKDKSFNGVSFIKKPIIGGSITGLSNILLNKSNVNMNNNNNNLSFITHTNPNSAQKKGLISILSPKTKKELMHLNLQKANSVVTTVVNTEESVNENSNNTKYSSSVTNSKRTGVKHGQSNSISISKNKIIQNTYTNKKILNTSGNINNIDGNISKYFNSNMNNNNHNISNIQVEDEDIPKDLENELEYMYEYTKKSNNNNKSINNFNKSNYVSYSNYSETPYSNTSQNSNCSQKSPMLINYKNNSKNLSIKNHNETGIANKSLSNYSSPKYSKLIDSLKSQFNEINQSRGQNNQTNKHINLNNNQSNYYSSVKTSPAHNNIIDNFIDADDNFDLNNLEIQNKQQEEYPNNFKDGKIKDNKNDNVKYKKISAITRNKAVNHSQNMTLDTKNSEKISNDQRLMTDVNEFEKIKNRNKVNSMIISKQIAETSQNNSDIFIRNNNSTNKIVNTSMISYDNHPLNKTVINTENIPDDLFYRDKRYIKLKEEMEGWRTHNTNLITENREMKHSLNIMKNYILIQEQSILNLNKDRLIPTVREEMDSYRSRLNQEKEVILTENNQLKSLVIKIISQIQQFEDEESIRERELQQCYNQIIEENRYLRSICESITANKLNNDIDNNYNYYEYEAYNKKSHHKRQDTKVILDNNQYNYENDSELNLNLSFISNGNGANGSLNNVSNISYASNNTVKSKDNDLFKHTINEMNKTMKRINTSYSYTKEKEKENLSNRLTSGRKEKMKIHYGKNKKE